MAIDSDIPLSLGDRLIVPADKVDGPLSRQYGYGITGNPAHCLIADIEPARARVHPYVGEESGWFPIEDVKAWRNETWRRWSQAWSRE